MGQIFPKTKLEQKGLDKGQMRTGRKGSSCAAAIAFVSAREVHVIASVWGSGSEFSFRFRFRDQGLGAR